MVEQGCGAWTRVMDYSLNLAQGGFLTIPAFSHKVCVIVLSQNFACPPLPPHAYTINFHARVTLIVY